MKAQSRKNDELDALWPKWMVEKRDQIRAERLEAMEERKDPEARDPHVDCSVAELQRQARQDARRREERNDVHGFYRPDKFRKQPEQSRS